MHAIFVRNILALEKWLNLMFCSKYIQAICFIKLLLRKQLQWKNVQWKGFFLSWTVETWFNYSKELVFYLISTKLEAFPFWKNDFIKFDSYSSLTFLLFLLGWIFLWIAKTKYSKLSGNQYCFLQMRNF